MSQPASHLPPTISASHIWGKYAIMSSKSKAIVLRMLPPRLVEFFTTASSQRHEVPPLRFPEVPNGLPQLLQLGLNEYYAQLLYAQFVTSIHKVDKTLSEHYCEEAPTFCGGDDSHQASSRLAYIQAAQNHLLHVRTKTINDCWSALLVRATSLANEIASIPTNASTITCPSSLDHISSSKRKRQGRPSPFTPEQTFALNALLAHDDQYSPEAKEFIAQKLGLTRDQVNRWFCNARARKKQVHHPPRGQSLDSVRTVSSDFSDVQSNTNSQTGFLSETTHSTPNNSDRSPSLALSAPDHDFASQVPNSVSDMPQSINLTFETNSMDDYMDYAAYLEPQSNDNLDMSIPIDVTSSAHPQPVLLNSQLDHAMEPSLDAISSFNDSLFQPFNFNPDQSLLDLSSKPPEPSASNEDFLNFDLSNWGFLS